MGDRLGLDRSGMGLAIRLAVAAWLAFAIASAFHVRNAYWAAMPIWVVAQPSRGLVLERGFFRVFGTMVGAGIGILIVRLPVEPHVRIALLSGWLALQAGLTHVLRGVHGYGPLLAGITATIVVVPTLGAPDGSLDLGLARVECTLIGVVVVTFVIGATTPDARREDFYAHVRNLGVDALEHAARAIRRRRRVDARAADGGSREDQGTDALDERAIVTEIAKLDATTRLISAGSVEGYRRLHHVESLVVGSLSVLAAGETLEARAGLPSTDDLVLADWLDGVARALRTSVNVDVVLGETPTDDPAVERLQEGAVRIVDAATTLLTPVPGADARSFAPKLSVIAPHREWSLAARTAARAGILTFLAVGLAQASGSPAARLGALGTCMIFLVLSSMAEPRKIAPELLKGLVAGVAIGTMYRIALQPHLESTFSVVLSVAPFLLLGGLARASRKTAIAAIDFNMGFLLASLAGMPAEDDVAAILRNASALLIGAALVATSFIVLPRRHGLLAEEARRLLRSDLERMAKTPLGTIEDWHARASRQVLRLALHIGRASARGIALPTGTTAVLALGASIGDLRSIAQSLDSVAGNSLADERIAREALDLLKGPFGNPRATAVNVAELAHNAGAPSLRRCLFDIAGALGRASPLVSA